MKKILILLNAVVYNRGSEALIRGLSDICKKAYPDSELILSSSEPEFEKIADYPNFSRYINRYSFRIKYSPLRCVAFGMKKIGLNDLSWKIRLGKLCDFAKQMDLILIIGADNYDHTYNMGDMLHSTNKLMSKACPGKLILTDCSFAKEDLTAFALEDMKLFDKITVRESVSMQNVEDSTDLETVCYYPDPAFIMQPQKVDLPKGFKEGNTVGINLSKLILSNIYGSDKDVVRGAYTELIDHILKTSDSSIALIPHVMQGADLSALRAVYESYIDNDRVVLVEDETLNAPELKYIISKCSLYVGARTHSTIAAYSSCIPTLVLGYSVKSIGIAKDLFGTDENYVLPVSKLQRASQLTESFKWLENHKKEIKTQLENIIPDYQGKVWDTSNLIRQVLND